MTQIETENKTVIKYYSSAKECPMDRYTELQKWLVIESGIGSNIESINARYLRLRAFIEEGRYADALIENENAFKATISALEGVSYISMAFACLVAAVGGETCDDITESGLQTTVQKIIKSGITYQELSDVVDEVKKKIQDELNQYYPNILNTTDNLIYVSRMKGYILSVADCYANLDPSEEDKETLKHQYNWFLVDGGAKNFRGDSDENIVVLIDKNFINACSEMEDNGSINPHKYTVIQFYGKWDYLSKQDKSKVE